jgi:hypothetical protein
MTDSHDIAARNGVSNAALPSANRRLSPAIWIAVVLLAAVVGVAVSLQLFVANRIPDLTAEALDDAESRWQDRGPASYDVDFEIRGAQPGDVHVEVRDGEVVAMSRNGVTPKQPRTWAYWSVPGRFEEIVREIELAEDPEHEMNANAGTRILLRCDFDPALGYPRTFHRMIFGGGPEVYWHVTRFESM